MSGSEYSEIQFQSVEMRSVLQWWNNSSMHFSMFYVRHTYTLSEIFDLTWIVLLYTYVSTARLKIEEFSDCV